SLAHLAGRRGFVTVNFNAAKPPQLHRAFDHRCDAPAIARGVDEGKTDEAFWTAGDQAGELGVGSCIVVVKKRKHDSFVDACGLSTPEIGTERGVSIPRCRHRMPLAGVAVKVDDHKQATAVFRAASPFDRGEARKWRPCT